MKEFQEWSETPLNVVSKLTNPAFFVIEWLRFGCGLQRLTRGGQKIRCISAAAEELGCDVSSSYTVLTKRVLYQGGKSKREFKCHIRCSNRGRKSLKHAKFGHFT